MLLIHYNIRHIMEKIVTPGEAKVPPQTIVDGSVHAGLDVSLGDLREWHALRAWWKNCSHHAEVKAADLIRRYGKDALFSTIEKALLCTSCDPRRPGQVGDPQAATELARFPPAFLDRHIGGVSSRESRTEEGGGPARGSARMGAGRAVLVTHRKETIAPLARQGIPWSRKDGCLRSAFRLAGAFLTGFAAALRPRPIDFANSDRCAA